MEPDAVKDCLEAVEELIREKEIEILRARFRKAQYCYNIKNKPSEDN